MAVGSGVNFDKAWKANSNVAKCNALYQSVILLTHTLAQGKYE